jgi:hypothetical protein
MKRQESFAVNQQVRRTIFVAACCALVASCGAAQGGVENSGSATQSAPTAQGNGVNDAQLPINQRFRSLDEYLAWLQTTQAPVDGAWYKQISPGVYELQTGNLRVLGADGEKKKTFTREELERKFGFSR